MDRIFRELSAEQVPLIMFGVGASHLAGDWHDLPLDVVGLDWRLGIDDARKQGITKRFRAILIRRFFLRLGKSSRKKRKRYLIKA